MGFTSEYSHWDKQSSQPVKILLNPPVLGSFVSNVTSPVMAKYSSGSGFLSKTSENDDDDAGDGGKPSIDVEKELAAANANAFSPYKECYSPIFVISL